MAKNYTWDSLNVLATKWYNLKEDGDESSAVTCQEEIFIGVFSLMTHFKDQEALSNGIAEFWLKDWKLFDPNKGSFSGFLKKRLSLRSLDVNIRDRDGRREEYEDDYGKKRRRKIFYSSLDTPLQDSEGSSSTMAEIIADPNMRDPNERFNIDASAYQCLSLILSLPEQLKGRANNPTRINYFRMFFTDGVSKYLRDEVDAEAYQLHEHDLFQAMKIPFLDYFLERECRTIPAIIESNLKPYCDLVEGRPNEQPKQPLPNDVYSAYLLRKENTKANESAVSQQRTEYRKFMKAHLF